MKGFEGRKHSERSKKKMSESSKGCIPWNKGLKNCYTKKGQIAWNKGLTKETDERVAKYAEKRKFQIFSEETKKKIGDAQKKRKHPCGELSTNWKGGIAAEPYCDVWLDKEYKQSIKERDGYKCLNPECNKTINKLCIHHIDYNKKECQPTNLITLCFSCNSKANKNREWHQNWYQAIINKRYNK